MKQIQEIIHIVPEKREAFLNFFLQPSDELKNIMRSCGIRNQCFYELEDYILETFEYGGNHFYQDLSKLAAFLEQKGVLVKKRRRDVPADELNTTSWWAPLRKLGNLISEDAEADSVKEDSEMYREMTSGYMDEEQAKYEMSYSEDDWSESIHY